MIKQKTIFLSTLLLILILGTTSFAVTEPDTLTSGDVYNILNYFKSIEQYRYSNSESLETRLGYWDNIIQNVEADKVAIIWNQNIDKSIYTYMENISLVALTPSNTGVTFELLPNTNTIGETSAYLEGEEKYPNSLYYRTTLKVKGIENYNRLSIGIGNYTTKITERATTNYITIDSTENATLEVENNIIHLKQILGLNTKTAIYIKPYGLQNYGWWWCSPYIETERRYITPVPDESGDAGDDETSGDTGGGTTTPNYSDDLDNIQNGIGNINNNLENIQQNMPTSGDIKDSQIQANKDYWGSSEELNGENQEELIEGKVDELIETVSGDLNKNEIFNILETYQKKLFGSFTGQEDFKIAWNDISYKGTIIIPNGEINFSQMCRENETLGKVKTTVNIILGFLLLLNCIIYLYNLLLATLGIDNPYLYEKAEDKTSVTYSTNMNTGKTTETTTMRKKDGKTFKYRRDI